MRNSGYIVKIRAQQDPQFERRSFCRHGRTMTNTERPPRLSSHSTSFQHHLPVRSARGCSLLNSTLKPPFQRKGRADMSLPAVIPRAARRHAPSWRHDRTPQTCMRPVCSDEMCPLTAPYERGSAAPSVPTCPSSSASGSNTSSSSPSLAITPHSSPFHIPFSHGLALTPL